MCIASLNPKPMVAYLAPSAIAGGRNLICSCVQGVNTLAAGAQDMGSSLTSSAAHAVQQAQQAVGLTGSTSAGAGSGGIAAVTEVRPPACC